MFDANQVRSLTDYDWLFVCASRRKDGTCGGSREIEKEEQLTDRLWFYFLFLKGKCETGLFMRETWVWHSSNFIFCAGEGVITMGWSVCPSNNLYGICKETRMLNPPHRPWHTIELVHIFFILISQQPLKTTSQWMSCLSKAWYTFSIDGINNHAYIVNSLMVIYFIYLFYLFVSFCFISFHFILLYLFSL